MAKGGENGSYTVSQPNRAKLTQTMVDEQLTFERLPIFNEKGRIVKFEPNGDPAAGVAPKRFVVWDGHDDSPGGFGVAINRTNKSYILQRRVGSRVLKATIGKTRDIKLERARRDALAALEKMRETGLSPAESRQVEESDLRVAAMTVEECFAVYKAHLASKAKPAKDSSLRGVDQALRRLGRPEIGLAHCEVGQLITEQKILDAFETLASGRRKLVEGTKRDAEKKTGAFDTPTVTSAEQTFRWATRAVDYCMSKEERVAANLDRKTSLRRNPFLVLRDEGKYRTKQELEEHYQQTKARNPMLIRDGSLGRFLDALWERRKVANYRTACDYLLLTLLWGTRRGEAAPLHWRAQISKEEARACSWVDLEGGEVSFFDTKNRFTHTLPLAPAAKRILQLRFDAQKAAETKWVFPARSSKAAQGHYLDSKAILEGLRKSGKIEQLRTHDLRRTFATVAEEMATYSVVKRMLNHRDLRDTTGKYTLVDRDRLLEELARVERAILSTAPFVALALLPLNEPLR